MALYNIVKPALSVIIDIQVNYYFKNDNMNK